MKKLFSTLMLVLVALTVQAQILQTKITVNAFCRKSLAFSQRSWATLRAPGIR